MTSGSAPFEQSYSAETARHTVLASLVPVVGYPLEIWRHRYLVANFFRRDLLGRFRGSALGLFWVLVHPIFMFAVYYLVFGYLFGNQKVGTAPTPEYALYLFSGVIAFTALIEGTSRSCTCVIDNGNLVKKVAFPSQLLPVPLILVSLTVYVVGALVCLGVGLAYGVLQPGWSLLLLPVVLLIQFVMTLGIGLFLANTHVFSRDTSQLWGIFSAAWMFLTPVFWYPHALEGAVADVIKSLFAWNPAYPLLQAHRLVLGAQPVPYTKDVDGALVERLSDFGNLGDHLLHASLWALAFLFVGYAVFMSRRHKYADLV
ncbi:MAG TPA: ABC transporter permease [Planctomycetota bacterium]